MWAVKILTLFPEIFPGQLILSVPGRSMAAGIWSLEAKNIRDYARDQYKAIDEPPYGGGGGMVMRADILGPAIEHFFLPNANHIIYPSPRGILFNQKIAEHFASMQGINILCGRFEGIDERIINEYRVTEISIGDFMLSAGDIAAIPIIDSCIRLLPGVFKNGLTLQEESFGRSAEYMNLLEYPHYTKPKEWKGNIVPDVLLSGDHKLIHAWRLEQAKKKTKNTRPDLWEQYFKGESQ